MSPELELIVNVAKEAGEFLRENYESDLVVDELKAHDIKLELDVKTQQLITDRILERFPDHAIYGEEGIDGDQSSACQWIVDPIDGTVNYFYGIPHFCVTIALRESGELKLGVIYDPMLDEMYAVDYDGPATRNGQPIQTSGRSALSEAMVTASFPKTEDTIEAGLERFKSIACQVRKTRMMGSAAMALAYVACGRLDVYIEETISLWDIAAGVLMVERGGGNVELYEKEGDKMSIVATNGKLGLDSMNLEGIRR